MDWLTFTILGGLASTVFNIFNRAALKTNGDSSVYGWWFELLRMLIFIGLFMLNPVLPSNLLSYFWLFALGMVELVSIYFFMKAHQLTELSLSTIVIRLRLIWTPLFAYFLLGEHLHASEYLGIFIVLIGVIIAISPHTLKIDRGIVITLISSFVLTILSLIQKKTALIASPPLVMIAMSLPSVVFLPFIIKNAKKRLFSIRKKSFMQNLVGTFFNVISMYCLIAALRFESTSKVNTIFQSMMVVSLFFGIVFFHERKQMWQKILGTIVTICGLFFLIK
jgi:drug/metabolite transporter (DMT)-like permease